MLGGSRGLGCAATSCQAGQDQTADQQRHSDAAVIRVSVRHNAVFVGAVAGTIDGLAEWKKQVQWELFLSARESPLWSETGCALMPGLPISPVRPRRGYKHRVGYAWSPACPQGAEDGIRPAVFACGEEPSGSCRAGERFSPLVCPVANRLPDRYRQLPSGVGRQGPRPPRRLPAVPDPGGHEYRSPRPAGRTLESRHASEWCGPDWSRGIL